MAYWKATHKLSLLRLVFVIWAFRSSHVACEGRAGAHEGKCDAANPSGQGSRVLEADGPTRVRPSFQSIVDVVKFWATAEYETQGRLDSGNEIESEVASENVFSTSGAEFVYSGENEEEPEEDGESHLLTTENSNIEAPSCRTGNYIDDCWRCDSNWQDHRQQLASCGLGFGKSAQGGKGGKLYVVNTNSDDVKAPAPGTLRYGATRKEPLWIVFARSLTIQLQGELQLTSFKTIDGRGAEVHLVGPSQISIVGVSNVIVHGIHVHDIERVEHQFEGDAIHILNSSKVWVDHCYLARAYDGLVDVTRNSTAVTVSNCYFEHHSKVMLFGASADDNFDRNMQVTVAFNKFGTNLTQRMPRCRYGNCHVANNFYTSGWKLYAVGGSEDPTILSQSNQYVAPDASDKKEVTQRLDDGGPTFGGWETWDWTSSGDSFANGAFFTGSGVQDASARSYDRARSFAPRQASWVGAMTQDAGPLTCAPGKACRGRKNQQLRFLHEPR